jgi:predicted aminopeptidase
MKFGSWVLNAAVLVALAGCQLGYYLRLARGEQALLAARVPVAQLLADPQTDAELKTRLARAERARAFASDCLDLPRNDSYTEYADLHRPYAMWNVYAAAEFSLAPLTRCFPIAGCVAYRGYYDFGQAQAEARRLQAQGYETYIGGVPAYSTLGWFDDPILNTMLRWDDDMLAATIFHELAHQKLYLKGDTAFNESFATFVQEQGLRQWRAAQGLPPGDDAAQRREEQFTRLVLATRARLAALYAQPLPPQEMRRRKQAEFAHLRADYRALRAHAWAGVPAAALAGYDAWMKAPINNAKLLPFGLYHRWVPAFAALFRAHDGDWPRFFAAVEKLSTLDEQARQARLAALAHDAAAQS